jgi:hypothetical protein
MGFLGWPWWGRKRALEKAKKLEKKKLPTKKELKKEDAKFRKEGKTLKKLIKR